MIILTICVLSIIIITVYITVIITLIIPITSMQDVIHVETSTGVVFEVTADLTSTSRPSPESWRLHHHSSPREVWQTETAVQRQLLEEVTESYCAPDAVVLAVPS